MADRLLFSQREAIEKMGLSVHKLHAEVFQGRLRYVQIGHRWKFLPSEVERWIAIRDGQPVLYDEMFGPPMPAQPLPLSLSPTAIFGRARSGAKLRGKLFKLTVRDVVEMIERAAGKCEVSDIPFSAVSVNNTAPFAPSIDRIDSSLGYTPENCRLVCYAVNVALHQWGDAVLRRIAEGIVRRTHV